MMEQEKEAQQKDWKRGKASLILPKNQKLQLAAPLKLTQQIISN